jgi:hypothetical protein
MSAKDHRLLDPSLIPESLWNPATDALHISPALAQAYVTLIGRHELKELGRTRDQADPPVGGLTKERTDKYFAQAFDGAAARAQLALLDPKFELSSAPNTYLISLAGNKLSLTDAPCGSGAAALSFLSLMAELRSCNVLPRHPLDVLLLGAELSEPARSYAQEMLDELRAALEEQAIFVEAEFLSWDVTNQISNTNLIKRMAQATITHPKSLLVVANFNSFLVREKKRVEAMPQLNELFRYASGPHSVAIWIEPDMNRATGDGGLFSWLQNLLRGAWGLFARPHPESAQPVLTTRTLYCRPLSLLNTARVNLAIMPIDLARS